MSNSNSTETVSKGKRAIVLPDGTDATQHTQQEAIDIRKQVIIQPITPKLLDVEIIGTTPLIVCAWSHKAKQQMKDKQGKKATRGREAKVPEEDYKAALYVSTEGWTGIPASGVKGAMVNACRATGKDLPMTLAKRMIFVLSQGHTSEGQGLVRIYGKHEMHEAMVRIDSGKTADIRYRPIYREWSIKMTIEYLGSVISAEQVCNLLELAGFVEGLCEHRPGSPKSCTGDNGRFRIKRDDNS